MRKSCVLWSGLVCLVAIFERAELCLFAEDLGALSHNVTAESPVGWRGDGSGRYPDADPPTHWQRRIDTQLKQLRCQAVRPTDAAQAAGKALSLLTEERWAGHYGIRDWLVLGPHPVVQEVDDRGKMLQEETVPNQAELNPVEGQRTREHVWKRVDSEKVDLLTMFGPWKDRQVAYCFSHVYAPEATVVGIRTLGNHHAYGFHWWINGKLASIWDGARHRLNKGWNRILLKVLSPEKRTDDQEWQFRAQLFPFAEDTTYSTQGIAWTTRMPDFCYGMPIIVGDNLYTMSDPADLVCVNKHSGKIQWIRSQPGWTVVDADSKSRVANHEDLDNKLARLTQLNTDNFDDSSKEILNERREIHRALHDAFKKAGRKYRVNIGWGGGVSAATPTSDGKFVYVWHGETGVLACYDLQGNRRWIHFEHPGRGGEHGVNSSPVIVGDRIIVLGGASVLAFDRQSGRTLWRQEYRHPCYPSLVAAKRGDQDVVICGNGTVIAAADGKLLAEPVGRHDGECASPLIFDDKFCLISRAGFCVSQLLPSSAEKNATRVLHQMAPEELDTSEVYCVGSPVYHEGLVYAVRSGWGAGVRQPTLYAIDPNAGKLVYRQPLDLQPAVFYDPKGAGVAASLALAGKYIYVMDNRGVAIVFEPGRKFRQVAKNHLEHVYTRENNQEVTNSTPIFDGQRMYYRGYENLYCIGPQ